MSLLIPMKRKSAGSSRLNIRKWNRKEEEAIIKFLKDNPNFEKPTARIYYTKFLNKNCMDINWKLVLHKIRNMRITYRKVKQHQINEMQNVAKLTKNSILNTCWYMDDFDILFPNDLEKYPIPVISTIPSSQPQLSTDYQNVIKLNSKTNDFLNQESNINLNSTTMHTNFKQEFLHEEPTINYFSKSIAKDILAVQTGKFNYKKQRFYKESARKQQKLELAKKKLEFEKEKFREEIRLKEKQIDNQERLKIMELEMKERKAMKELELKKKLKMVSEEKANYFCNNIM